LHEVPDHFSRKSTMAPASVVCGYDILDPIR
jgi:hypothetical protein